MAYDKIIPIRRRLDHCVDYALNEEKTSLSAVLAYAGNEEKNTLPGGDVLETALNCELGTAYRDMMETKRRWDKRGGVLGYHIVHSYVPGEVTPQEAHAAGVEFARRLLGERFEAVVSTHIDQEHLHCHIVFNSVSFVDGEKYRNDFKAYFGDIRETSNEVSRDYGLSVIVPDPGSGGGKHYAEWAAEKRGKTTVRGLIRQDMDAALSRSFTLRSFWTALERRGYTVKRGGKYVSIRPPGGARFIRLNSLGQGYTEADLTERLTKGRAGPLAPAVRPARAAPRRYTVKGGVLPHPRRRPRSFRALYFHYVSLLRGNTPSRRPVPFPVRKEVTRLRRYTEQFQFLREYRIDTGAELSMLADAIQAEIDALSGERKDLYQRRREGWDVTEQIEEINEALRPLRRKLKLCSRIEADIPRIREQIQLCRDAEKAPEGRDAQEKQRDKERRHDLWR